MHENQDAGVFSHNASYLERRMCLGEGGVGVLTPPPGLEIMGAQTVLAITHGLSPIKEQVVRKIRSPPPVGQSAKVDDVRKSL